MNPTFKLSIASCVIFFLLFVFSSVVSAQESKYEFPCNTIINNTYYDWSPLQGNEVNGSDADNFWIFYASFCQVAPHCKEDGAMACQAERTRPDTLYDIAFPNDNLQPHFWDVLKSPPGVQLTVYGGGKYCKLFGDYRRTIIQVLCDPTKTGPPTSLSKNVTEGPTCTYTFTLSHAAGCALPVPPATNPPTDGGGGSSNAVTGAGFGLGFAIAVIVSALAVGGYIYYQKQRAGGHGGFKKVSANGGGDKAVFLAAPPHGTSDDV